MDRAAPEGASSRCEMEGLCDLAKALSTEGKASSPRRRRIHAQSILWSGHPRLPAALRGSVREVRRAAAARGLSGFLRVQLELVAGSVPAVREAARIPPAIATAR